ncbi:MAG: molybdopterin-dependent oxidoreductase [Spirochaetaceae bacterium]|jgi:xanthine dehydrogenase molybdopterin-binding subunit B|nr:molybdopterin-dependent oxidoreductase [Spirochaetaceae bacterium]
MNERYLKDKLLGKIRYPQNNTSKKILYIKLICSPIERGSIEELSWTEPFPKDYFLIKAKDIPGKNTIDFGDGSFPLLADEEVYYPYQPIALLVGPAPQVLKELEETVKLKINKKEILPEFNISEQEQCSYQREIRTSSSDGLENKSEIIWVEDYFEMEGQQHSSFPPAHSRCQNEGMVFNIHCITQWPWIIKKNVQQLLKLPKKMVKIRCYPCENHQESKIFHPVQTASFCALASFISKKNCLFQINPEDNYFYAPPKGKVGIYLKAACNHRGELLHLKLDFSLEGGAYPLWSKERVDRMCFFTSGVYHCRNLEIHGKMQRTTSMPTGLFPDGDLSSLLTSIELFSNIMAEECKMTPLEWKTVNLIKRGNGWFTGALLARNPSLDELIKAVVEPSDYQRKYSAYQYQNHLIKKDSSKKPQKSKGIALSLGCIANNFLTQQRDQSPATISMTLDQQGLSIELPAPPGHGQLYKIWSSMASEALSIDENNIRFDIYKSEENNPEGPSCFSRNVTIIHHQIKQCINQIAKKRFREPLPLFETRRFRRSRNWDDDNFKGHPYQHLSWGAAVVELELNHEDNSINIQQIYIVLESGKILLPSVASSVVNQAIGQSLQWIFKSTENYNPMGENTLPFNLQFLETSKEPKALDGLVQNILPAAIMQAIAQASCKNQHFLPVTPGNWERKK